MDPEQAFLRVHARLSGMLSQLLTSRIRTALEYISFVVAVSLFCLTVVMHINFVQQPGCSSELSRADIAEVPLVHIKITSSGLWSQNIIDHDVINTPGHGSSTENLEVPDMDGDGLTYLAPKFWLNWISSGARSKLIPIPSKSDEEFFEPQAESIVDSSSSKSVADKTEVRVDTEPQHIVFPISFQESFKAAVIRFCSKWHIYFSSFWRNTSQFFGSVIQLWNTAGWDMAEDVPKWLHMFHLERLKTLLVQWLEKRSKAFEPTYLYTVEKGYFLLPEEAKSLHNVTTFNISISAQHSCFGNRWQKLLINSFVGYDTILMNSLLSSPGQGYLYNFQTKEFYDLNYGRQPAEGFARFTEYLVTKCGVLIMSLFVFFTTTMSVSFTLRETQSRMLKFTVQLQHHALHRLPTFQLIFVHVIESLVFVPIMIGILFFLFEFYDDQMLAFMVLTLVWLCELFTMISVRTPMSIQFFPRFFLLYFLVFHIYFFSYGYGFSYLAFSTTAAFMQHLILCFWNRFEVPALLRFMQSRSQVQQQQLGVHITSSILTSTFHIARVNMRNPISVNNELGSWPLSMRPGPGQTRSDAVDSTETTGIRETMETESTDMAGSLRIPRSDPRQTEIAPTASLNSLSSLLLWILGGSSSNSLVSFFSIFRDVRDQGQVHTESSQHESGPTAQNSWWRRT